MRLSDVKVGSKLIGGFLAVAFLVGLVGLIGIVNMNILMATADRILEVDVALLDAASEADIAHLHIRDLTAEALVVVDPAVLAEEQKRLSAHYERLKSAAGVIARNTDEKIASAGRELLRQGEDMHEGALSFFRAKNAGCQAEANRAMEARIDPAGEALMMTVEGLRAGLGRALFQALAAIHAKGLAHGSIQPSNVMVLQGQVRLADFGFGRLRQRHPGSHRAPAGGLSAAADVYAAAAVLYHLVSGQNPAGPTAPAALQGRVAGVPAPLERALLRCLSPEAAQRPSAEQVLAELSAPA